MFRLSRIVCAVALMAVTGAVAAAGLERKDTRFMQEAAQAGMFEVSASQMAGEKASHPDVKAFASMMISDHTRVADELKQLAGSKNVELPTEPSAGMRAKLDKLQGKSAADFDKEYAKEVAVDAHQDAVKLFSKAAKDAADPEVKAFATRTLPVLQQHLARGKEVESLVESTHANAKMSR